MDFGLSNDEQEDVSNEHKILIGKDMNNGHSIGDTDLTWRGNKLIMK
jgi:hypothetical protein